MIDRKQLLSDLQALLRKEIEPDLRKRSELPEIAAALKAEFDKAKKAKRTAMNYTDWRADTITQIGVAWVLSCVFIRFLEDNRLVDPPRLSGPTAAGDSHSALQRARDEYDLHIESNLEHSFRQYILSVIDDLAKLSGGKEVFGKNNIIHQHRNWLSNDAVKTLYNFWQKLDPATGDLVHNFTDDADEGEPFDTRFLGDLYQDLSEAARKKYALLQTPDFVEEFILDRTLEPALDEFGLEPKPPEGSGLTTNTFRMIDPACGSGHFLLGAFDRILDRWQRKEPGTKVDVLVERTLASIYGVDVNPFAVSIARFRLLLAAFRACHVTRLNQPIDFHINVACGDSLYHGRQRQGELDGMETDESHYFQVENVDELKHILREGSYHAVVANPPYITPKDKAANDAYRNLYSSCHMKYSLSVPFVERIFCLAVLGIGKKTKAGFTGQITSNSFMKREFGKKLIEGFLKTVDLSHVVDLAGGGGAHIPGHATPTVILFGRHRRPLIDTTRTVMGIHGDRGVPEDPAKGEYWTAMLSQIDMPGSESEYLSVDDLPRSSFSSHPWSIGGGGIAELKESLDRLAKMKLSTVVESIGPASFAGVDDAFVGPFGNHARIGVNDQFIRDFAGGDQIRDWQLFFDEECFTPYDASGRTVAPTCDTTWGRRFWSIRRTLESVTSFGGKTRQELGDPWWTWYRWIPDRVEAPKRIVFAFIATHNHFVIDQQAVAFNRSAPVVMLKNTATDNDYLALLGILNSSVACFWMKQVLYPKATTTGDVSTEKGRPEANRYEFGGKALLHFPLPFKLEKNDTPTNLCEITRILESCSRKLQDVLPMPVLRRYSKGELSSNLRTSLELAQHDHDFMRKRIIALQEELDWESYKLFGISVSGAKMEIVNDSHGGIESEDRPFLWNATDAAPSVDQAWQESYETRHALVCKNANLKIIEDCVFKRPWWGRQGVYGRLARDYEGWLTEALQLWLLTRLESYFDFDGRMNDEGNVTAKFDIGVTSVAKLADVAFKDAQFKEVAEVYRGRPDFDPVKLIDELVANEHVPALPILRYKPTGIDKRAEWENTWRLQRMEDQIHAEVERTCRDALTEESAAAADASGPLDPYKARLVFDKVDFAKLAELVSTYEPTVLAAGVSARSEPAASAVGSLKKGFAESKLGTLVDLQRLVAHEILGDIPVPSKYQSSDFISTGGAKYWKLRGKLDVPKERWISLPHCQGEDQTLGIAWAGYDHLQLLQAIAAYFAEVQQLGGSEDPRLVPLLAAMDQQIPWVKQWHNDTDNEYGYALGDYFEEFIATEARNLSLTMEDVRAWTPPTKVAKATKPKKATKAAADNEDLTP